MTQNSSNKPNPRFLLRMLICSILNKNLGAYFRAERCN
ncbi:hypothetical protein APA_3520 [Pseudanabaena sp. lw0831]|nr:hypothetical protein APA_3520 [Pseudanabaena sp. lw0831]